MSNFGFAPEVTGKNTDKVNLPNTPGQIMLENILCVVRSDWTYLSLSGKTREEQIKLLESCGMSDSAIKENFI
jgi:hypothetical protein